MKRIFFPIIVLSVAMAHSLLGATGKPAAEGATLTDAMEEMNAAFRRLSRQVNNPARNADSLELVSRLRVASEASMTFSPERSGDLSGEEREAFVKGYQRGMKLFLAEVQKLEGALKAGDNAAAADLVEALKEMRNEGHRRYKRPDDT